MVSREVASVLLAAFLFPFRKGGSDVVKGPIAAGDTLRRVKTRQLSLYFAHPAQCYT